MLGYVQSLFSEEELGIKSVEGKAGNRNVKLIASCLNPNYESLLYAFYD